jgi:hypothetical protein
MMLSVRRMVIMLSQAESLVELLSRLHTVGTIKLTMDPSIQPHGISRIDVVDPYAFRRYAAVTQHHQPLPPAIHDQTAAVLRSARLRWFQRADISGSGDELELPGRHCELEKSVNQAFRRWPIRSSHRFAAPAQTPSPQSLPRNLRGRHPSSAGAGAG